VLERMACEPLWVAPDILEGMLAHITLPECKVSNAVNLTLGTEQSSKNCIDLPGLEPLGALPHCHLIGGEHGTHTICRSLR
jgi:hypothetical protein